MFGLFESNRFIKSDGSFNSREFQKLLQKSRAGLKKSKRPGSIEKKRPAIQSDLLIGGISDKEVWQFINKLSNFVNSGVDIKTGCSIVEKQLKNARLRKIVGEIRLNLDYGLSISDTLRQYDKYFDPLVISTIEIGEKTGNLPKVLTELEVSMLEQIEIRSKIRGAMIYPMILMLLAFTMVIFMLVFILPKITGSFKKSGVELPALTKFLMDTSDFLIAHYVVLLGGLILFFLAFKIFSKTYTGQYALSWIGLRIPVFGYIARMSNILTFINSMNLLLDAGVLMLQALEISADVVPNMLYKQAIIRIKNEVEVGIKVSVSMRNGSSGSDKESPLFPDDFVHMVGVGEETGTIAKSMKKVGETYSKELRRFIGNLMSALEPFIIVFIGAIVGTIVIAIMLPFFKLAEVAKKS